MWGVAAARGATGELGLKSPKSCLFNVFRKKLTFPELRRAVAEQNDLFRREAQARGRRLRAVWRQSPLGRTQAGGPRVLRLDDLRGDGEAAVEILDVRIGGGGLADARRHEPSAVGRSAGAPST